MHVHSPLLTTQGLDKVSFAFENCHHLNSHLNYSCESTPHHITAPAVRGRLPSKPRACWSKAEVAAGQGAAAWLLPCPSNIAPGNSGADCDAYTEGRPSAVPGRRPYPEDAPDTSPLCWLSPAFPMSHCWALGACCEPSPGFGPSASVGRMFRPNVRV